MHHFFPHNNVSYTGTPPSRAAPRYIVKDYQFATVEAN